MKLFDPLFRWAAVAEIFSATSHVQALLDFAGALARAEARAGIIPSPAAAVITAKCRAELFDLQRLSQDAAKSGNLAIPLVHQLTALVSAQDQDVAKFVHWGATSQDAIDTASVLQLQKALELISEDADRFSQTLEELADVHRSTVVAGRTWMQHALPTTFGMKMAGFVDAMTRHAARLHDARGRCLVLQFGGAVGTLAALGMHSEQIAENLAAELKLPLPALPWHSHRDRPAEIATTLGLIAGTLGKFAGDLALHMQTEIAEIFEPAEEGRGGSSTMPHKRNPVTCAAIISAATRVPALAAAMLSAMPQEHERGLGGWQAEWETLPQIVQLTAGALHELVLIAPKLEIDAARMNSNLEITRGLIYAEAVAFKLAEKIGRPEAQRLLAEASRRSAAERRHLRDILRENSAVTAHLPAAELESLFDAHKYLGASDIFIDRAIAASRAARASRALKKN